MDELIGLIIQGIIALLGDKKKSAPPPIRRQQPPPGMPTGQQRAPAGSPRGQPGMQQTAAGPRRVNQAGRPQQMQPQKMVQRRQQALANRRGAAQRRGVAAPPPLPTAPQPAATAAASEVKAEAAATTPSRSAGITGAGIRQLMVSRPAAMRTIYVLTEVVGKPLALRE